MKKSLTHLPKHEQDELKRGVRIICKQFPSTHMIILFSGYARGDWVEDIYTDGHIYRAIPSQTATGDQKIKLPFYKTG